MTLLHTIVSFIVALGVLIVVHEYGHYLMARLCDVKVLRFSVGFGRPLAVWRKGRDRTECVIAAIPFGGYVKMLDEREAPVEPRASAVVLGGAALLTVWAFYYGWHVQIGESKPGSPILFPDSEYNVAAASPLCRK